jgi:hypothetical protein
MREVADQSELGDWVIESQRSHYSLLYWIWFVIGTFGEAVPTPPEISYRVRNGKSNEVHTFTLPGDHTASDLLATVRALDGARKVSG